MNFAGCGKNPQPETSDSAAQTKAPGTSVGEAVGKTKEAGDTETQETEGEPAPMFEDFTGSVIFDDEKTWGPEVTSAKTTGEGCLYSASIRPEKEVCEGITFDVKIGYGDAQDTVLYTKTVHITGIDYVIPD